MVRYFEGTVFNAGAEAIVNTVNCMGVMGAGLALEFKLRYPDMFADYEKRCKNKELEVGKTYCYRSGNICIVNFPTKWHFKYPSDIRWIESGLKHFAAVYKSEGIRSVAFPKLGTLNGKLSWDGVRVLMEKYLSPLDIEVMICLDTDPEPRGLEADMVNYFNANADGIVNAVPRLSPAQKDAVKSCVPLKRFWKLSKADGLGTAGYSKIFLYCKDRAEKGGRDGQLSFFE